MGRCLKPHGGEEADTEHLCAGAWSRAAASQRRTKTSTTHRENTRRVSTDPTVPGHASFLIWPCFWPRAEKCFSFSNVKHDLNEPIRASGPTLPAQSSAGITTVSKCSALKHGIKQRFQNETHAARQSHLFFCPLLLSWMKQFSQCESHLEISVMRV